MALHFITNQPKTLLNAFKNAIDEGRIVTWSYDSDNDFTHTAAQWKNLAWLRPKIKTESELHFVILPPQDRHISSEVYAIYHGRFIEAMLRHCDKFFDNAIASSFPEAGDKV